MVMANTRLSSKGQVIIPRSYLDAHHWKAGQELVVIDTEEGVLLKPARPFPPVCCWFVDLVFLDTQADRA